MQNQEITDSPPRSTSIKTLTTSEQEDTDVESTESNAENATTGSPEAPELDYKALYEQGLEANVKLTNDNKSLLGRLREPSIDPRMDDILDELGGLRRTTNAMITRTASGETEELAGDLVQISKDSDQARATRQYDRGLERIEAQLEEALRDEDGALIVDIDSPEVKELVQAWTTAKGARDLLSLSDVVTDANKLARRIEREKIRAAASEETEDEKAASKTRDAKAGVHDLSVGSPAAGSGKGKSRAEILKATKLTDISDEDYARYLAG